MSNFAVLDRRPLRTTDDESEWIPIHPVDRPRPLRLLRTPIGDLVEVSDSDLEPVREQRYVDPFEDL